MSSLTSGEREKLEKIFAESWARDAERNKQRRIKTGEFEIELEGALADPPVNDATFQAELNTFGDALHQAEIPYSKRGMAFDAVDAHGYALAEFTIRTLGPPAIGIITAAVSGWLAGRAGRKARLKFGDVEAEGRTPEEVKQLLESAATFRASIKESGGEE